MGYDIAGRITSINNKNGAGTTIDALTYTYDHAGRVATETSTLGTSKTYTYDPAGQITSDGTHSYSWDKEGNNAAAGWTTNSGNELSTDGTWNYSYDAAGNETQKTNISNGQVWLYYYDNANRLVKAEHKPSSGGSVDQRILFSYDVFGNRIEQDVDPTGGGTYTTTKYAYDPNGNAWADLSSGGTLQVRRLYADAMDALYAKIGSGGVNWMLPDLVGSIRDITNSSGSLIDHRDWDAFGNLTYESSSANGDRYGFTGREWSTELSLQYNRARWYDPATKRWMSQDPLGFDAGDSNLYRYVGNSTNNAADPSGLVDESAFGVGIPATLAFLAAKYLPPPSPVKGGGGVVTTVKDKGGTPGAPIDWSKFTNDETNKYGAGTSYVYTFYGLKIYVVPATTYTKFKFKKDDINCHVYTLGGKDMKAPVIIPGPEMKNYLTESKEWIQIKDGQAGPGDMLVIKGAPGTGSIVPANEKDGTGPTPYVPGMPVHSGKIMKTDPLTIDQKVAPLKEINTEPLNKMNKTYPDLREKPPKSPSFNWWVYEYWRYVGAPPTAGPKVGPTDGGPPAAIVRGK